MVAESISRKNSKKCCRMRSKKILHKTERSITMKRVLCMILCLVGAVSFTACDNDGIHYTLPTSTEISTQTSPTQQTTQADQVIQTVREFLTTVEQDGELLNGKTIEVFGTVKTRDDSMKLFDWSTEISTDLNSFGFWTASNKGPSIIVYLSDNTQLSSVSTGDYVKVCGTVYIVDGQCVLIDSQCTKILDYLDRTTNS